MTDWNTLARVDPGDIKDPDAAALVEALEGLGTPTESFSFTWEPAYPFNCWICAEPINDLCVAVNGGPFDNVITLCEKCAPLVVVGEHSDDE